MVKRHTSRIYNSVTATVTGIEGEDFNSGLKAMKREVMNPLVLYGELHRYIPVLASGTASRSARSTSRTPSACTALEVRPRALRRGFLDLLTVKFITTYTGRPFHLFGGLGSRSARSAGAAAVDVHRKLLGHGIGQRPA